VAGIAPDGHRQTHNLLEGAGGAAGRNTQSYPGLVNDQKTRNHARGAAPGRSYVSGTGRGRRTGR
jgi:hypothetical protein